ncbi:hypothetical protein SDC9_78347 [bioreactor metagenome]|uniref:Uncharacterized protein n=1 Tax=bioreactor metagenome TaxID=1076179 RepID=A0A644YT99_9ZZZZ
MNTLRLGSWTFLGFAILTTARIVWQLIPAYRDDYLGMQVALTFPLMLFPLASLGAAIYCLSLAEKNEIGEIH